ncbi:MAG: GDP-mannose 4,6-dehydratase, partial [Candidatus Pacearchaeota archaeon]|nr:GDP-mannose 4,6-dehydratase [Candidatus Pacearchaeota archaeon]
RQTRDFVFVGDAAEAALKGLGRKKVGIFNVGTGKQTSVQELLRALQTIVGSSLGAKKGPARPGEQQKSCLAWSGARRALGWKPKHALREGLRETVVSFQ